MLMRLCVCVCVCRMLEVAVRDATADTAAEARYVLPSLHMFKRVLLSIMLPVCNCRALHAGPASKSAALWPQVLLSAATNSELTGIQ